MYPDGVSMTSPSQFSGGTQKNQSKPERWERQRALVFCRRESYIFRSNNILEASVGGWGGFYIEFDENTRRVLDVVCLQNKCADIKVHVVFTKIFVYSSYLNITVQINIENMSQW